MTYPLVDPGIDGEGIKLGATYLGDERCRFVVWAPYASKVDVCLVQPVQRIKTMNPVGDGFFQVELTDVDPSSHYFFRLYKDAPGPESTSTASGEPLQRPDPASRHQPDGVHGPSRITADAFPWQDGCWFGLPFSDYVIYELHVGTFTPEGTFDAVIAYLDELKELGVTAIELMPVAQFPGSRNWGYDGVYPFAAQSTYGGPQALKRLVNACHLRGLAVVLDVVYNHLGPEGNYLRDFGPYFSERYRSPWGEALNFDDANSDPVRRFFIENALYWVSVCRIDALRLDAVHAIYDFSARPFLQELQYSVERAAERQNRRIYCIAESDLNDTRIIRPRNQGGFQMRSQWNDDFHHALHTLLTGERTGYYSDFGRLSDLRRAWQQGYVYGGRYSVQRGRRHGNDASDQPTDRFVVFSQNHDQIGNRLLGERLSCLVSTEKLKTAAAMVLLSPYIPLLFMGEEYGERAPFQYFVSHTDAQLVKAVREGRRREFAAFKWAEAAPDPQDENLFLSAKLQRGLLKQEQHRVLLGFYRELIRQRRRNAWHRLGRDNLDIETSEPEMLLSVLGRNGQDQTLLLFHLDETEKEVRLNWPPGVWDKHLDSADACWLGPGSRVPRKIVSNGMVGLHLPPWAVLMFRRAPDMIPP